MKKVILTSAIALLITLVTSCGGSDCYRCKKLAYFNGINTTAEGDWGINCKKKNESDADFEQRIQEKRESGYKCEPK